MEFQFSVVLIGFFLILFTSAKACTTHADCLYGYCGEEQQCLCNLNCNLLGISNNLEFFGCSNRSDIIVNICHEISESCQLSRQSIRITKPTIDQLQAVNFSCFALFETDIEEVEFCEDQSYCHFNGICLRQVGTTAPFCMCNGLYFGLRCENIIHPLQDDQPSDVSMERVLNVRANFAEDTSDSMNSGWKTRIIVAVVAGFGCMLVIFISVFIRYKRKNRRPDSNFLKRRTSNKDDMCISLDIAHVKFGEERREHFSAICTVTT